MPQSPTILFKPVNPKLFTCSALPFPAEDTTHVVGSAFSVTAVSDPPWCFPRSSAPPCTSGRTGSSELEARVLISRLHIRSLGSHVPTAFRHARADRPGAPGAEHARSRLCRRAIRAQGHACALQRCPLPRGKAAKMVPVGTWWA